MTYTPSGEERQFSHLGGAAIDGAPVAYIVALASVAAVLALIPFSFILSVGTSFPMSQGIYPLVGWLLGPVAGAVASGVGAVVGLFLAPHTAGVPVVRVVGAVVASFAAGVMTVEGRRRMWWLPLTGLFVLALALYVGRAIWVNGVAPGAAWLGSFIDWSALLLFALPTRVLAIRWLRSQDVRLLPAGLFLGTWMAAGVAHLCQSALLYWMINWPNEVWLVMAPMAPVENAFRGLVGVAIGTGVIAGVRAIGLVKPREAQY